MEPTTQASGLCDNASSSSDVTSSDVVNFPSVGHNILGSVLVVTMTVGIFTNSLGIAIFVKDINLRTPTNLFIASLALCDLVMLVVATPLPAASCFAHHWIWGYTGCVYEGFMVYFLGLTSLYLLCAISVDRYVVIVLPLRTAMVTKRFACFIIFGCYGLGFFWAMLPLVGWNSYQPEGLMTSCSVVWDTSGPKDYSYNVVIFFTCLIIPILVMIYCYYHVYMTVRTVNRNSNWDMSTRAARKRMEVERKISRTILIMIGVYIGSWTPYTVVSFWAAFGVASDIPLIVAGVPPFIAKTATVWNPIIYICTNKQFRTAFFKILPSICKMSEDPDEQMDTCEMEQIRPYGVSVSRTPFETMQQQTDCHVTDQSQRWQSNHVPVYDYSVQETIVEQIHISSHDLDEA